MTYERLLTLALVLMTSATGMKLDARQITLEQARQKAAGFWNKQTGQTRQLRAKAVASQTAPYYIFNDEEKGFVIIAGDDAAKTVLGYSTEGTFDEQNIPDGLKAMLDNYSRQITALQAAGGNIAAYKAPQTRAAVGEKQLQTAKWAQTGVFAQYTPKNTYTGCAATAMGIVMRYHKHPAVGMSRNRYLSNYAGGILEADFFRHYAWNNMPTEANGTNSQFDDVAKLMADLGIATDMKYGTDGSGTTLDAIEYALKIYFKYSLNAKLLRADSYSDAEWKSMLRNEIDNNRPIIYRATNEKSGGGHAFVIDGYKGEDMFSFNWGWGGNSNGYYALGKITDSNVAYNLDQAGLFGIEPETESPLKLHLHVDKPGSFRDFMESNYENKLIEQLVVSGNVNHNDISAARSTAYIVLNADFSNATFTKEPRSYWTLNSMPNLKSLILPNGITTIESPGFRNSKHLLDITIPATVKTICDEAFSGCNTLESITILGQTPPALGNDVFWNVPLESATLHVPAGSRDAYAEAVNGWEQFTNIIGDAKDIYTGISSLANDETNNLHKILTVKNKRIATTDGSSIDIYDMLGRLIGSKCNTATVESGLYVVKSKGQSVMIAVP